MHYFVHLPPLVIIVTSSFRNMKSISLRSPKNILVIEDHPLSILGVEILIGRAIPSCQVRSASNFTDMIHALKEYKTDLALLDLQIPGASGKEAISMLRRLQPGIRILVYSGRDELIHAPSALHYGANGFISKTSPNEEIINAIETVLNGGRYVSQKTGEDLLNSYIGRKSYLNNPLDMLSPRENEILQLLTQGRTLKEIGDILKLKYSTVSTHKERIFQKLDVENIVELIKQVERYSL